MIRTLFCLCIMLFFCIACDRPWNNPHRHTSLKEKIYYGSFAEQPKTLDPARSYSSSEILFTAQIYEPPLQYHYLLRPYTLEPLTAVQMPRVQYFDKKNRLLKQNAPDKMIAYSVYTITLKPTLYYQPHPAFAKDTTGRYRYQRLTARDMAGIHDIRDFRYYGTRKVTAADYVYEIKRLASPQWQSPIFGFMSQYIVGFEAYRQTLQTAYSQLLLKKSAPQWLDLRKYPLSGVRVVDEKTYQIKIKGKYPQFRFWLAMPFFAAMPWEAEAFFSQPLLRAKNMTLDTYPVGSGPYMLIENNPNHQMVLVKNPNFRGEKFPSTGIPGDKDAGYLKLAGKALPMIDRFIFSLEKEDIPRWNKFLQGYYDASGISSDSFDQAITFGAGGEPQLTAALKARDIHLQTSVGASVFFVGFNMQDDVIGGYGARQRYLRQAISIALNYEELIHIFLNGRGIPAQGPIPPGIFGYLPGKAGMNPIVYTWRHDRLQRKSLDVAKKLLAQAGYPAGRDESTGQPLVLHYDVPSSGGPDDRARFEWMRKQFAKLGIQLNVRSTQYNRYQDKLRRGNVQLFFYGWNADYPDPENFLFLYYGPNGKARYGGENATNYHNEKYDVLFLKMRHMIDGPQRQAVINRMLQLLWNDAPSVWAFYPTSFALQQGWNAPMKPHAMANNVLKYMSIDPDARRAYQYQWNTPIVWPIAVIIVGIFLLLLPAVYGFYRREYGHDNEETRE